MSPDRCGRLWRVTLSAGVLVVFAACAGEGSVGRMAEGEQPPEEPLTDLLRSTEGSALQNGAQHRPSDRHRGVSWVASRDTVLPRDFSELAARGVNWIVQTPFGWQADPSGPEVRGLEGERGWWGERDEGLERTAEYASAAGIRTMLKPHIWLSDRNADTWRGDIAMETEADWAAWFSEYADWILRYAALAERLDIEALAIGTELGGTVHREAEWRALIRRIRSVYGGELTYAANWHDEYRDVPFWDALDWVGVQAYFPLSEHEFPSADVISAGWEEPLAELEELHRKTGKPIVFTELGYRSVPHAAREPWLWPTRGERSDDPRAFVAQAEAYEAFFPYRLAPAVGEGGLLLEVVSFQRVQSGTQERGLHPSGKAGRRRDEEVVPGGRPERNRR